MAPVPGAVAPRFVECAGFSPMSDPVIEIVVESWEIECCAPPPVVGEQATWWALFVPSTDHPFSAEHLWSVVPPQPAPRLHRDGVVAAWGGGHTAPAPPPGEHRLRGHLSGAAHVFPEDLPPVTGRVRRLRVLSHEFAADPGGTYALSPIPGSVAVRDVDASPRWFARPAPRVGAQARSGQRFLAGVPQPVRYETGIVVDLHVEA